jgi:hypothetical protein
MATTHHLRLRPSTIQRRPNRRQVVIGTTLLAAMLLGGTFYWFRHTTPHRMAKRFVWAMAGGDADVLARWVMPAEQAELGATPQAIKIALDQAGVPDFQPTRVVFFDHPFQYEDFYEFMVTWQGRDGSPLGRSSLRLRSTEAGWRLEFVWTLWGWCRLRWGKQAGDTQFYRICRRAGISGWVTRFGTARRFGEPDPWTQP